MCVCKPTTALSHAACGRQGATVFHLIPSVHSGCPGTRQSRQHVNVPHKYCWSVCRSRGPERDGVQVTLTFMAAGKHHWGQSYFRGTSLRGTQHYLTLALTFGPASSHLANANTLFFPRGGGGGKSSSVPFLRASSWSCCSGKPHRPLLRGFLP